MSNIGLLGVVKMLRKLFPWFFKKEVKIDWHQSSFICASMAEVYAKPTIVADATGLQTTNTNTHKPKMQYDELLNLLIQYGMTVRFVHAPEKVIAEDPQTVYVYLRPVRDEIRLVGKNGIDVVSFVFENFEVKFNEY